MKKYIVLFVFLAAILIVVATSQKTTDRHHIRLGNRHFGKSQFDKAYIEYGKAISENPENSQAAYNMACVMTATENDSTLGQYQRAADMEHNPVRKAMSWHNIGVIMQTNHKYPEAIEAYKNALRSNPADDMTRYNLALCRELLKNQQQQQQQQQQNQDQNGGGGGGDQNKDQQKQDQNQNGDNKQNKDNSGRGKNNASYWDNVGDNYQNQDQHDKARDSYKQALKNDPDDQHAKDNMKKSEQKLKEQQQQRQQEYDKKHPQQQQQQGQAQNSDQNNNNQQPKQQQQPQQPQQGQPSDQEPQGQPAGQMSQDNAQRLLEAAVQQEKQTQKRLQGAMQQPPRKRLGKNW